MPSHATVPSRFLGCDVGKNTIVVFDDATGTTRSVENTLQALTGLADTIAADSFVVCEATGGYEAPLLAAMTAAGIACHRADARKVKAFIRSFGTLGKTDAIDAKALARYGRERHPGLCPWRRRDAKREELQSLVLTRQDLVKDRTAWSNRLKAPGNAPVTDCLRAMVAACDEQIKALEGRIQDLYGEAEDLAEDRDRLTAINGIGENTAASLLALMPELGTLSRRQAAALAGLAPHPNQSATIDRYRRAKGGRPKLKRALFMAAMAATRHNKTLNAFYNRLIGNGKKPIVAITAVMRKLIVIANAVIKQKYSAKLS